VYAEGDGSQQQQSQRAALDRYALHRPQLRRADALRNVPMDVDASAQTAAASTAPREPADPVSGESHLCLFNLQLSLINVLTH